jgi:hypothetical protein
VQASLRNPSLQAEQISDTRCGMFSSGTPAGSSR